MPTINPTLFFVLMAIYFWRRRDEAMLAARHEMSSEYSGNYVETVNECAAHLRRLVDRVSRDMVHLGAQDQACQKPRERRLAAIVCPTDGRWRLHDVRQN